MAKVKYRLGIDLGANSLGWCAYHLNDDGEPFGFLRMGARIFSDGRDPKSLASLAQDRRLARQTRRRRDRLLKRRRRLIDGLVRFGLMPENQVERHKLKELDPFELRARGLDQPLPPYELGRAIYHLARKRGFRSSRKDRGSSDSERETGKVKEAIARLRNHISGAGCRTVGEYLARQHAQRLPVRGRQSSDGQYVLYLQREMVADEFDALWRAQSVHHPNLLTSAARDYLRDAILFQRRLRPVEPGRCQFEPDEFRAPLCSPIFQKFRLLQDLNHLRIQEGGTERTLTLEERNILLEHLRREPQCTFTNALKLIGYRVRSGAKVNLESAKRNKLVGDKAATQFGASDVLASSWFDMSDERQQALAELVVDAESDEALIQSLSREPWSYAADTAAAIARCRMPEGFASLSLKALRLITPCLEREVIPYSEAVTKAGYLHHSYFYTGEVYRQLPYYGELLTGYTAPTPSAKDADEKRHGKIPNPTVHIGLNQLRIVVNALIRRFGHPFEIVIELTREFGASGERRRETEGIQAENQQRNARYDEELNRLGQRPSRANRQRLQLWEELGTENALDRQCIYSGRRFSKSMLFSDEVEIDHVLPFSRSLHDGIGNKVLCTRQANRDKGNRTPHEAFGNSPGVYKWDEIVTRASQLPGKKALLFQKGALEKFLDGKDFLDRHLSDTGYLSRAAKHFLTAVCPPQRIWVSSGRLTGLLRGRWGLSALLPGCGKKNRNDHRHHALDAAVIGLCTRSLIQRLATAAERAEKDGQNRLLELFGPPWGSFHEDLRDTLPKIIVSHKPDHSRETQLHNDTNYGLRGASDRKGVPLVARRVPIESLAKISDAEKVADPLLRQQLVELLKPLDGAKEIKPALSAFTSRSGIRRVVVEERLSVIPIASRKTGKPYRYVKGDSNYCYEIFKKPDGKWDGEVIDSFRANQKGYTQSPAVAANGLPLIMRIHKEDLIAMDIDGKRRIMRIAKFTDGAISLAEHHEANVDFRDRDKDDPFHYLRKSPSALRTVKARNIGVCPLGYVNDRHLKD